MFTDDDFDIFQEEFGQEVIFKRTGDTGNEEVVAVCKAYFDNEFLAAELFGVTLETSGPVLTCKSSDIKDVVAGDTVEVVEYGEEEATTFSVIQIRKDGTGQTLVVLGYHF